jgi:hypothetical protein
VIDEGEKLLEGKAAVPTAKLGVTVIREPRLAMREPEKRSNSDEDVRPDAVGGTGRKMVTLRYGVVPSDTVKLS